MAQNGDREKVQASSRQLCDAMIKEMLSGSIPDEIAESSVKACEDSLTKFIDSQS